MHDTLHLAAHPTGPGRVRVTVAGDLDVVSAPDVRDTLRAALANHRSVLVDCGGLTLCDCTGLSALLAAARAAKASGRDLQLCAVPHPLAKLLRLTWVTSSPTVAAVGASRIPRPHRHRPVLLQQVPDPVLAELFHARSWRPHAHSADQPHADLGPMTRSLTVNGTLIGAARGSAPAAEGDTGVLQQAVHAAVGAARLLHKGKHDAGAISAR